MSQAPSGTERSATPPLPSWIDLPTSPSGLRWICAACGVGSVCALGFLGEGSQSDRLAQFALAALGLSTAIGWWQLARSSRVLPPLRRHSENRATHAWPVVVVAVTLIAGLAVQAWFKPGTSIATGDIAPPDGTAWLSRMFEPWAWTGSNLGEASQLPLQVPWAAVLGTVHALGGDPQLAQRIWYTALFVGAALGALAFMAALRIGPVAALVGATIYVLNPLVVSEVNIYGLYMAALGLLAAIPAVLLAVGTGRLSIRWGAALLAASAPMLGYIFFNPPLVGMIIGATVLTPLLVAWIDGTEAASRSLRALLLAAPLLLAASAYWVVAAILHLSGVGGNELSSLSSWTWTEARASIRNAFWLNTSWAWTFPEYFPYAPTYDSLPLSVARFLLPALAFATLGLGRLHASGTERSQRDRLLRVAVAASTVALIVIFLSTGTNAPGNLVFDRLYSLPFGWLIREPGRFLMVAALAYAALAAVAAEALAHSESVVDLIRSRRLSIGALKVLYVPAALGTVLLLGFPLYTGAVVIDQRPSLPSAHVRVPSYWTQMAKFVDSLPMKGGVLVMPPDDFYAMPYTWGYYGNDGFVVELFQRPILVPSPQGYTPTSSEVMSAVDLTAQSILHHDWGQTEALATALHTPLLLVRRDIESPYPGRTILRPNDLAAALSAAPNFVLVRQIGSLDLFALSSVLRDPETIGSFVTINSQTPDLRLLSVLPPGTAIISSQSVAGVPSIYQAPPLELWQPVGDALEWRPASLPGSAYRIADLETKTVAVLDRSGSFNIGSSAQVSYVPDAINNAVTVSITGRAAISNGDFANGPWGVVGDCYDVASPHDQPKLVAKVMPNAAPGGLPAMQLSASLDNACVNQPLTWHGGPLVISLMAHHVEGAAPSVCLWEVGPNECAALPAIPITNGWTPYRVSVKPDLGTTALTMYLYADAAGQGARTIDEYADVQVIEVPALPSLALLATSGGQSASPLRLVVMHNSYSDRWGVTNGRHVVVDGMLNGWLIQPGSVQFTPSYGPTAVFRVAQFVSLAALILALVLFASVCTRYLAGRTPSVTNAAGILRRRRARRIGAKERTP